MIYKLIGEIIGTPYVWWKEGDKIDSNAPFWAENSPPPSSDIIKNNGCNCAGFINLICRYMNVNIPGISQNFEYAGGTYIWYLYLQNNNLLDRFNPCINYPHGTLLLRNYVNESDQGHIALVINNSKLVHCYPDTGITIDDSYMISHNWHTNGYYTHVCLPKNWLYNYKIHKN